MIKHEDFVENVVSVFDEAKELFRAKKKQYATQEDPLANFTTGANLLLGSDSLPAQYTAAKCYVAKHIAQVYNTGIDGNKVDESLVDIINYCAIMLHMRKKYIEQCELDKATIEELIQNAKKEAFDE